MSWSGYRGLTTIRSYDPPTTEESLHQIALRISAINKAISLPIIYTLSINPTYKELEKFQKIIDKVPDSPSYEEKKRKLVMELHLLKDKLEKLDAEITKLYKSYQTPESKEKKVVKKTEIGSRLIKFTELPDDAVCNIYHYLTVREIARGSAICRSFNRTLSSIPLKDSFLFLSLRNHLVLKLSDFKPELTFSDFNNARKQAMSSSFFSPGTAKLKKIPEILTRISREKSLKG